MNTETTDISGKLEQHGTVFLLFTVLVLFSFTGSGIPCIVSAAGLLLCAAGFIYGKLETDFKTLLLLMAGLGLCLLSSLRIYGNIKEGYTELFAIYPVMYVLFTGLNGEEGRLLRKLCILWAQIIGACAVLVYIYQCFHGTALRAEIIIGNANELGIFFVTGWFAVLCRRKEEDDHSFTGRLCSSLEPLIPAGLALTLSMGSFLSLCTGLLVYGIQEGKADGHGNRISATVKELLPLAAEMSIYIGTGMVMNLGEREMDIPQAVFFPAVYLLALCIYGRALAPFFRSHRGASLLFTGAGALGGLAAVMLRPGASYNFMVRLEMMKNGLTYLRQHPFTGVGANQWRLLNLEDSRYFSTWHIHNSFLHLSVELGIFAGILLLAILIREMMKKENRRTRPAVTAFILHNFIDTSFFYLADTSLLLLSNRYEGTGEKKASAVQGRIFFSCFSLYFIYCLVMDMVPFLQGGA